MTLVLYDAFHDHHHLFLDACAGPWLSPVNFRQFSRNVLWPPSQPSKSRSYFTKRPIIILTLTHTIDTCRDTSTAAPLSSPSKPIAPKSNGGGGGSRGASGGDRDEIDARLRQIEERFERLEATAQADRDGAWRHAGGASSSPHSQQVSRQHRVSQRNCAAPEQPRLCHAL
jgi:hypothetical protein